MAKLTIKIFLLLLLLSGSVMSQSGEDSVNSYSAAAGQLQADDSVYVMHKSPLGAVLRSAVIPGWGQFYNRSYWKIPVVWGFIAFYSYYWIDNNKEYRNYIDIVSNYERPGADFPISKGQAQSLATFYRDNRDLFAIYIGLTYALNLLDAYVDAQLFDFSVEEDVRTKSARLSMKFHF